MRTPNYKVGWLIENKLAALTHYHADITQEDITGVFIETQKLLKDIQKPFQIIIDNRLAPLNKIYSLEELQRSSPLLCHPYLNYLVVVKPNHLELGDRGIIIENRNNVYLKNVPSVNEAIDFISQRVPDCPVSEMDHCFFDNI